MAQCRFSTKALSEYFFFQNLNVVIPQNVHEIINLDVVTIVVMARKLWDNILRPRQNGHYITDDILKCIILNDKFQIIIQISLKFIL